ncbi:hypothetical protein BV378_04675 [Nostoc sp. RF31YmG]|nr:hypothetical protein BV378_04675 [Nostoc sp. RF31YmG]
MSKASDQQPSRLDRIEQILLLTTTALGDIARQQQVNTNAIAQVTARLDQLTLKVDNLTESVGSLNEDVVLLTDYLTQVIQNAETDRETFQAEIRRIWEYLLQRGGNGRAGE